MCFLAENNKWSTGQVSCQTPPLGVSEQDYHWSWRDFYNVCTLLCWSMTLYMWEVSFEVATYNYVDWTQVFNIIALIYSTTKHKNNRRTSKNAHVYSMQATALLANTVMLIHPAYNTHCSLQIGGILSITWSILPTRIHSPQQHWYINQTLAQCLTL